VPTPRYPNFAGKHAEQALFSAADFVAYQRQVGALDDREVPGGAVLCYQPSLAGHLPAGAAGTGRTGRTRSVRDKFSRPALLAGGGNSSAGRALVMGRGFCSGLELSLDPAAH
jgi:hypothetical protein